MKQNYHSLFERLSDAHHEGKVEAIEIEDSHCVLRFARHEDHGYDVARCKLELFDFGYVHGFEEILVRVTHLDGSHAQVYVSPVPSAVIAVCLR